MAELREVSAGLGVRVRAIGDFGRTLYLVIKHPDADLGAVAVARQHAERLVGREDPDGLRVIANGNNVAVIPTAISKAAAVDYLLEHYRHRYGPVLSLGVGDALSDAGFLSRCDFAVTPTRGQIWTEWAGETCSKTLRFLRKWSCLVQRMVPLMTKATKLTNFSGSYDPAT